MTRSLVSRLRGSRTGTMPDRYPNPVQSLLKNCSRQQSIGKVRTSSLAMIQPPGLVNGDVAETIWLSVLWRLRRGRPYALVSVREDDYAPHFRCEPIDYLRSLPILPQIGGAEELPVRYIGLGDVAPIELTWEEESLYFLATPPPTPIPTFSDLICSYDAVRVSVCDDLIVVSTIDPALTAFLDNLPKFRNGR